MKKLIAILSLVIASQTFAGTFTQLKDEDTHLSQANAEIVSVKKICPVIPGRPHCMAVGSVIKLKVTLGGCLDHLGGYFYDVKTAEDGTHTLMFAGITVNNKGSTVAMCFAAPTKALSITVPQEGKFEIQNMEFNGMSEE